MIKMENLNLYLKFQKPIKFYDVCIIRQPSFDEMLEYGIDNFEKLLVPYSITLDSLPEEITDEQKEGLTNFDLICSSQEFMSYLFISLEYFSNSKLDIDEKGIIFDSFIGRLNRDNFDEFAEIILKICGRERPKKERIPIFENERQKESWIKLQEGRRRNAKNNAINIEDILNICEFGRDVYIPIEEISKWTLWRIMNCYKAKIGTGSYQDNFRIYLVSGEKSIIENKHWTDLLKIDYQYKN